MLDGEVKEENVFVQKLGSIIQFREGLKVFSFSLKLSLKRELH